MFLICLLLIGLIAVFIVSEQESSTVEQAGFIPLSVRVNETRSFGSQHFKDSAR